MSTANERRQRVADLRRQTRQYLIEARERRLGVFVEPEPAPEPEYEPEAAARPAAGIMPDPHLAALADQAQAPELAPDPAPEPSPAPAAPRAALQDLPLGALRLLGQGMIWRLNNLGVHTLADLVAADPRRLSEGLGPIGRLVRTEVWIEAAREILAQG